MAGFDDVLALMRDHSAAEALVIGMTLVIGWLVAERIILKKEHEKIRKTQEENIAKLLALVETFQKDINDRSESEKTALLRVIDNYHSGTSSIREALIEMKATINALVGTVGRGK